MQSTDNRMSYRGSSICSHSPNARMALKKGTWNLIIPKGLVFSHLLSKETIASSNFVLKTPTQNTYLYEKSEETELVLLYDESAHSSFSSARIISAVHGTNNNIMC